MPSRSILQPCPPTPALEVLLRLFLESQDLLQWGHQGCPQPYTARAPSSNDTTLQTPLQGREGLQ